MALAAEEQPVRKAPEHTVQLETTALDEPAKWTAWCYTNHIEPHDQTKIVLVFRIQN
ncbi:hypothetical protein GCM10023156_01050 [Novipirellula rosea]|uniref:Uncharacterized protein n=1 Tax=Novipirellula rosea TaxID=1031540 RepID=A0ABP8M3S7_9BACT